MKGLRLVDLYQSLQGEGPRTGQPTTFIRFGGCNMRCRGWPCDTQYAIDPKIWKNDPVLTPEEVIERFDLLVPTHNLCITGGEPFMQPPESLQELAEHLLNRGHSIDVFTNGSMLPFPTWTEDRHCVVILDWKLTGSGEAMRGLEVRETNIHKLHQKDWVKMVIASEQDLEEAVKIWHGHRHYCWPSWSVGVAWGKYDEKKLVEYVLDNGLPWAINTQVHKYIFDPEGRQI